VVDHQLVDPKLEAMLDDHRRVARRFQT
jgi:hypothetical protein